MTGWWGPPLEGVARCGAFLVSNNMIPTAIKIKNKDLPDSPGVYFYYDREKMLLYIGKATSLKKRVGSYFTKAHNMRIAELVSRITRIDYTETPTVIEALVLEANQIKVHQPPYNVAQRDDKSFAYLVITNDEYPRPEILRGLQLEHLGVEPFSRKLSKRAREHFIAIYGPYLSARSLRTALDLVRRSIPWSTCLPPSATGSTRPCFDAQIGRCPGVCSGAITPEEYRKTIRQLMYFFSGKKQRVLRELTREMRRAAADQRFEDAAALRERVFALEHIRDIALITREDEEREERAYQLSPLRPGFIDPLGRIEAYDIAHISGTSNVGSMVVFVDGKPDKNEYRKFRIRTIDGANDVGAMSEVIRRRLWRAKNNPHTWPLPEVFVIDGGEAQMAAVRAVMDEVDVHVPMIGIAKGFDRKQDRLVFDESDTNLQRLASSSKDILAAARDEAHRFAGVYHRVLRSRRSLGISPIKKSKRDRGIAG